MVACGSRVRKNSSCGIHQQGADVKKFVRVVVVLVIVWLGIVLSGVMPRTNADQKAAQEALRQPLPPLGSRNAFASVWLSTWDVPAAERDAVMQADIAAWTKFRSEPHKVGEAFQSSAKDKYPAVPRPSGDATLCQNWSEGCLAKVRANPQVARESAAKYAVFAQKGEELAQFDHLSMLLPMTFDAPIPPLAGYSNVALTNAALKAVDGDAAGALADTCRFAATWRQLRAHTDLLIGDMVGVAYVAAAADLATQIQATAPADLAWPAMCDTAFAPLADSELDQCAEMHSEYRGYDDILGQQEAILGPEEGNSLARWLTAHFMNARRTAGAMAPSYAAFCTDAARQRNAQRKPIAQQEVSTPTCATPDWIFDPVGCAVQAKALPDFSPYYNRILDLDARLKALQTARWLRTQLQENLPAALAARPANLQTPLQPMVLSDDRQHLTLTLLDRDPTRHQWVIAMPPPLPAATPIVN
jgi:hypothetical protein